ncbi:hypothetical protein CJF30_00007538 [Rutstroemia sp. NJR-2017a BBW]|nr:hypothetical protein CJF30_00007538 [Rutstroemia sp. NJR-2017a BBW]
MTIDPRPGSPNHVHKFKELWESPKRIRVLQARADGKSWNKIASDLGLPKSTCRTIWNSQKERKNRQQRGGVQAMMSAKEVRKVIREISKSWHGRRMTFEQVRAVLGVKASVRTIRRELRKLGYRRCIACPRPFINKAQAKKRRVSVMIWGMIGWNYKSPLVFLEKRPGCKGVDSTAYKEQVLEPIIFPLFEKAGLEYIFMEDGSKVHKGHARLARFEQDVPPGDRKVDMQARRCD